MVDQPQHATHLALRTPAPEPILRIPLSIVETPPVFLLIPHIPTVQPIPPQSASIHVIVDTPGMEVRV